MFKRYEAFYAADDGGTGGGVAGTGGAAGGAAGGQGGAMGAGGPGAAGGTSPWFQDTIRADFHPTLAAKGWDKVDAKEFPNTVLEAYSGLEKLVGRSRLAVPKDAEDREAWDAIYSTMGRPGKATDYKLEGLPEEYGKALDPAVKQVYLDALHKAGVGDKAAAELFQLNATQWAGAQAAQAAAAVKANEEQQNALALEWGAKAEANTQIAKAAVRMLGLDAETMAKMETGLGYDGLHKFLYGIGSKLGEAGFAGTGGDNTGFEGGNPAAARAEITKLSQDRDFQAKLQHRDPRVRQDALARWEDLHKKLSAV